jgi:Tfp pilus assembly protein PilF
LVEGFAEYFMTAEIKSDSVTIGGYNENRVYWLQSAAWLPLEELLSKRPGEIRRSAHRDTYYPVAWLLTHWFMGNAERRVQLEAYLTDVRQGGDPVGALERATGLTLAEIRVQMRRYLQGRIPMTRYELDLPEAEITITSLPRSADDLLLVGQRLKVGGDEDARAETAELVRRLAARHPDDPFAMLQLGHAELHFGDPVAGEAILETLLEREPDNVEALQLMASRYIRLAQDNPDDDLALIRRARTYLARAFRVDPDQFQTLVMLARTRQGMPDYPRENDLLTWDRAFTLAPQLASIRLGYASALMQAGEFAEAIVLLEPLANAPHGGGASETAQELIQRARANQPPVFGENLEAAAEDANQPVEPEAGPEESATPPAPPGEAGES